jgi:UDP-N-acetylglucosamine 4,6-dehydratase/5-epimerase
VLFAFQNGNQGDLFVQKAPASTIGDLAQAIKELFNAPNPIQVIGTRHGEKLYETLCTREEMAKATDLENFYQIPADNRDLNYGKYFETGDVNTSALEDYNSHNTKRLNLKEVKEKLLNLDYMQEELGKWKK